MAFKHTILLTYNTWGKSCTNPCLQRRTSEKQVGYNQSQVGPLNNVMSLQNVLTECT